ncbi:MAG: murein transglycosylase A [Alphaproteobacteria bacterium]|nr:murein transglycosylase A [Alphaproteobacteria bacterium]
MGRSDLKGACGRRALFAVRAAPAPLVCLLALLLAGCALGPKEPDMPRLTLTPLAFTDLPGWGEAPLAPALSAFRRSCASMAARPPESALGDPALPYGRIADWAPACAAATALPDPSDEAVARAFFETLFAPWRLADGAERTGLFTGYYEPELTGARVADAFHAVPLHARPADLVSVELGAFRDSLKGERIAGRVVDGRLVPYATRSELLGPASPAPALVYVDDPVDAFFLHIQGSGRVRLSDGEVVRVAYDGQNGHPYTAIGRSLIARGALTPETVSMQTIRAWLAAHPDEAPALMNENRSYIFFRLEAIEDESLGARGAAGVPLTPEASLAVDPRFLAYGVPVFVDTTRPAEDEGPDVPFRRLLVAQDTGGAIRGVVRGDVYWGFGPRAAAIAGRMKHAGEAHVLLPRGLRPVTDE